MVFGFLLMIAPIAGALVIAIWIGAYALVFGVLLVALGFRHSVLEQACHWEEDLSRLHAH